MFPHLLSGDGWKSSWIPDPGLFVRLSTLEFSVRRLNLPWRKWSWVDEGIHLPSQSSRERTISTLHFA